MCISPGGPDSHSKHSASHVACLTSGWPPVILFCLETLSPPVENSYSCALLRSLLDGRRRSLGPNSLAQGWVWLLATSQPPCP